MSIVSKALIEQFERDGFVVVPDLLGQGELEEHGAHVRQAVSYRKRPLACRVAARGR